MDALYAEGGRERILEHALRLSGLSAPPEGWESLYAAAADSALAVCRRRDIPREMETAVAALLAALYREGLDRPVSSVRRGDTAITYAGLSLCDARTLLQPFIRLRTV